MSRYFLPNRPLLFIRILHLPKRDQDPSLRAALARGAALRMTSRDYPAP
jgi:hypothetical protein